MTDLLERAVAAARGLPAQMQDEIARMVLELAGTEDTPVRLAVDERESFALSLAQAERGDFATDAEVGAVWAKHGL